MGSYRRWGATWEAGFHFILLFHLLGVYVPGFTQSEHLLWVRPRRNLPLFRVGYGYRFRRLGPYCPKMNGDLCLWVGSTTQRVIIDQLEVSGQFLPFRV